MDTVDHTDRQLLFQHGILFMWFSVLTNVSENLGFNSITQVG